MNDMPACDDCGQWPQPSLAVDAVAIRGDEVLLIRRGSEPWKGMLAFPGGFVDSGESPDDAVIRELKEECGIETNNNALLIQPIPKLGKEFSFKPPSSR